MRITSFEDAQTAMQHALEIEDRDPEAALSYWKDVARYDPAFDHGIAMWKVGECLQELGNLDMAGVAYRAALSCEPTYDMYLFNYAIYLVERGFMDDAHRFWLFLASSDSEQIAAAAARYLPSDAGLLPSTCPTVQPPSREAIEDILRE